MDSKVKILLVKTKEIREFVYPQALELLITDKYNDFELADKKYKFVNNELIKQPSNRSAKESDKSKSDSKGA